MPIHATTTATDSFCNRRNRNKKRSEMSHRAIFETLEYRRLLSLPAGWSDVNIYNAAQSSPTSGSANYSNGVYTVSGSGFGYQFGFNYAYTTYTGDFDAKMRLTNITQTSAERTGAGIMIRAGNNFLDSNSIKDNWRSGQNEPSPLWFRMVRVGDVVTTYRSSDGTNWTTSGNDHLYNLPDTVEVGIAVTGPSTTIQATATVDSWSISPLSQEYQTSWVANTYGDVDAFIQYNFDALALGPDGVVYANTNWEEGGGALGIYGDVGDNEGGKLGILQGAISGGYAVAYDPATGYAYFSRGDYNSIGGEHVNSSGVVDGYGQNTNSNSWADPYYGYPHSMVVRNGELYIADTDNNQIIVYNLSTKKRVRTWSVQSPGSMAFDNSGNLWVVRIDGKNPSGAAVYAPTVNEGNYIYCYSSTGTLYSNKTISMAGMRPTAIAFDKTNNRLLVADNGPDQQIKAFTNLSSSTSTAPYLDTTFFNGGRFGYLGGVFAGATPGLVYDPAAGGNQRLYHPSSLVIDDAGNLIIGSSFSGGTLRKYDSAGNLKWFLVGENFVQTAAVDTVTAETTPNIIDVYTGRGHYKVDLSKPIGQQSTLYAFTWGSTYDASVIDTGVNRYSPGNSDSLITYIGGKKFLSLGGGSYYRFVGETAIAAATFYDDGNGNTKLWRDVNADGIEQSNESTLVGTSLFMPSTTVDDSGGIWMTSGTSMVHFFATGVDANGIPTFVKDTANLTMPAPFDTLGELDYDVATDTMYLAGGNADYNAYQTKNRLIARYDNWSTGNRTPSYTIELPYDLSIGVTGGGITFFLTAVCFDVTGDYIFVQTPFHPTAGSEIYVYDKVHGNLVTRLLPGPEVGSKIGNTDNGCKVHAYKRSNGDYLVFTEDDGYNKTVMFIWNPNESPTSVVTAAPVIRTDVTSTSIRLDWQVLDKSGVLTGYNVYRSTAVNGVYQKINSSLVIPNNYTDTNTVAGVTYYYKVTTVNAAGEGAASAVVSRTRIAAGAQLVSQDNTTLGAWKNVYGSQGYMVLGDATSMPSWAHVFVGGSGVWVDAQTTTTASDLLKAGSSTEHVFGGYYNGSVTNPLIVDVDLSDGLTHKVTVYIKAGHQNGTGNVLRVTDAATGQLLDVQEYRSGSMSAGSYLSFNISGHAKINIYNDGYQAQLQGVFIDAAAVPTTTQLDDPMANLSRVDSSRSTTGWSASNSEAFKYNNDQTRVINTGGGTQYLTWAANGATSFAAEIIYNSSLVSALGSYAALYVSSNGSTWTQVNYSVSTPTTPADVLRYVTLSSSAAPPAGTQYVRLQFNNAPAGSINMMRAYMSRPANTPPTVSSPISVSMSGNTATLNILGADNDGASNLTYSWAAVNTMPGAVAFSANGTNAASTTQAVFSVIGNYTIQVNVYDKGSMVASSSVLVGYSDQPVAPAVPTGVSATSLSSSAIRLNWTDASNNETRFDIDYSTNSTFATGVISTTAAANLNTTTITGLTANTTYYFRIRSTNSYGSSVYASPVSAMTSNSAYGIFTDKADVGGPAIAGNSSYASGTDTYTLTGAGNDIWDNSDQFQYLYTTLTGDGELIAKVNSLTNTNSWAKAGVMIRESLTGGSTHASMLITPGNGTAMQYRSTTGATSGSVGGAAVTAPYWVRITRVGNVMTGYTSSNGTSWTQVGQVTIAMSSTVYIGLAATSHNAGSATTATFTNVSLVLPQPAQTAAPTGITLAAASDTGVAADYLTNLNNSAAGKTLSFNVTGTVAGATVYLYADGNLIGQAVATGTTTLVTTNGSTTLTDGSHTFTAKQKSGSATISNATSAATVTIDTVPPKVSAVLASSSAWAASFLSYLSSNGKGVGGYQISGANQSRTLPWNNINQLKINFSEDVNVIQSSLSLRGTNIANYLTNAFAYSSATKQAVWTLASALGADRLLADLTDGVTDAAGNALDGDWTAGQTVASGNGVAGGHMLFRFNSLPGDTNGNGVILSNDVNAVRLNQFTTASTGGNYSIFNDIDGSGVILSNDVNAVRLLQFTLLPTNQPS